MTFGGVQDDQVIANVLFPLAVANAESDNPFHQVGIVHEQYLPLSSLPGKPVPVDHDVVRSFECLVDTNQGIGVELMLDSCPHPVFFLLLLVGELAGRISFGDVLRKRSSLIR